MNRNLQKLALRRKVIIEQIAEQRLLVAEHAHSLHQPLAMTDKVLAAFQYIKHHPFFIAGGGAALLTIAKPSGVGKWYRRGWLTWQILKSFRN